MSILLPTRPGIRTGKPRLLDFGATITPPMGGPAQRLNRLGNRFAIDVEAATSSSGDVGRILVSRLMQGLTQGVLMPFPQHGLTIGHPGVPVVNGSGQLGSMLALKGFTPQYVVREGQFLSIISAGRRYLHAANAAVRAASDGTCLIGITPMLRISPAAGDICEFVKPMIEGFLGGNALEWQLRTSPHTDVSFTITEAE